MKMPTCESAFFWLFALPVMLMLALDIWEEVAARFISAWKDLSRHWKE